MDFFIVFLPIFIVILMFWISRKEERQEAVLKVRKSRKGIKMNEVIKRFIGREVVISSMDNVVIGTVESVDDNWVVLKASEKDGGGSDVVNIDYIRRIRDYPLNKNGKKKTVFN